MPRKVVAPRVKAGTSNAAAINRREIFAHTYIQNGRNGTQAAITAGYSPKTAVVQAAQLLRDPKVRAIIDELTAEYQEITGHTTERLLRENARMCYFDPRKLYHLNGTPKQIHELDDDTAAAISHVGPNGLVPFDKNAAVEKGFKHLGLYERDNTQRQPNLAIQVILGK